MTFSFIRAFVLVMALHLTPAFAEPAIPSEALKEVMELHSGGNTEAALQKLETSGVQGTAPALYYYNRGVLLHALQKYGLAVASFEKAKSIAPGRDEVQKGLEASRSELARLIGPTKLDPGSYLLEKAGDEIPFDPFILFFAGLSGLGFLVIVAQKRSFRSSLALLIYADLLLLVAFLGWKHWMKTHPAAVVIDPSTVRSGPGNDYLDLGNVDAGSKIRIIERDQGWWKIRYSTDDGVGFLPAESLLPLVD